MVYDVTAFVHTHPGGQDVILEYVGRDATSAFEAVGHSLQARGMLQKLAVGSIHPDDVC
jgi:cytochrome b involved in lipid metabolism